ncbi:hypothetical protein KHA93_19670 [Bacillus sp. FJAT-49732]|uniref:Uncharacterized protein n=1 Tax=Lederbergia citrisecunda TaxID=2833583 RepID=A0A942YMM6_9BACI|nr:hypothetical protein [Lederbergia citrisecunda]MBS4201827.1 hypothetical protein [Lederbergia citrisecunda]
MSNIFNFRLDTSNIEDSEEKHEARQKLIKDSWNNITNHFLKKGKRIKLKYWPDDIPSGYSEYGIKQIFESDENAYKEIDTDELHIVNAEINKRVIEFFQKNMTDNHVFISPFFHFDIINEDGIPIFTSQDNGDNLLMFLTEEDLAYIDKSLLIRIPEM